MKPFLLLSKQSAALITHCLQSSETTCPQTMPKLYINRHLAQEHRANPALDPSGRNTVFTQVRPCHAPGGMCMGLLLPHRWPLSYSQWWECDFITEGIVDNGGGFRDSLSDVSEELCPTSGDVPVPLPFFVRTSNQVWHPTVCLSWPWGSIQQCLGAFGVLILALPALVWKQLAGEEVSWSKDFTAVDSELVKLLEMLERVDREAFEFMFGRELNYTTVQMSMSPGDPVWGPAVPAPSALAGCPGLRPAAVMALPVPLSPHPPQIAAMRAGLLRVVPQPVLDLLTWQQLEKKVCGDPEITVDELRRFITFEDFSSDDTSIQKFWEALNNFTREDLSRFLKFVTGRSRLPVQITVYPERANSNTLDLMPQACTCSCTFYLPNYSSAKACEELLRYAVYNCISIDTDKDPWD
ncbi:E3 ubiquitin-protein ligase HECTD3, partial [Podiceps cristatus]